MTSAFSWQNSVTLCPLHSALQGQICLLLQVFLVCALSCLILCEPWAGSSVLKDSRQEYGSGLLFHAPGHLLNPGVETVSLVSPDWHVDSYPWCHLVSR